MDEAPAAGGLSRAEVQQALIRRSLEDESFRRRLLAEPKATVEQELGRKLLPETEIRVIEATPETLYLVLPASRAATGELSDKELDSVAGGEYGGHVIWNWR